MTDGFLHRYFLNHGNRSVHKWTHYFDIYECHLERFRAKQPVVVEIGVAAGGSLQMWKAYFGEGARVVGIDINPDCRQYEEDGIEIFIGEQGNPQFLETVLERYPRIDIVIDDGSHVMQDMIASFQHLV